jgi:hypothetical protein
MRLKMDLNQIEKILQMHEERIKRLESITSDSSNSIKNENKELSIKEFMLDKQPKGSYQIGLAIGYFLEKNRGIVSFDIDDLESGFREAKEPLPKNMSDLAYKNTKSGLFMETKEQKNNKKSWVLTNTGERLVMNCFKKVKTT